MVRTAAMPRQDLARAIAHKGHGRGDQTLNWLGVLATPSRALVAGDPLGGAGQRIEIGVLACDAFLMASDDEDECPDGVVLGLRARPTVAVRWDWGPGGGVDSGVFGLWSAGDEATEDAVAHGSFAPGFVRLKGRVVLASSTGDGVLPCIVGYDDANAVCVLLAGDGLVPKRYGLREDARVARPVEGEAGCAVTRAIVAPFLLDPIQRARVQSTLAAHPPAPLGANERETAALYEARVSLVLAWALRLWARLVHDDLPAVATALEALKVRTKMKRGWSDPLVSILEHAMADLVFERWAPFHALQHQLTVEQLTERQRARGIEVSLLREIERDIEEHIAPALLASGFDSMNEMHALPISQPKKDAVWSIRGGVRATLFALALRERAKDLREFSGASPLFTPRDASYLVDQILADGDALSLVGPLSAVAGGATGDR